MAATAIKINPGSVAIESYQRRIQELTETITSHLSRFRRIAVRHLGNVADAEDAVQDALLSALIHVDEFEGRAKMSTWLTTIVINSARMTLRRRLSRVQIALDKIDMEENVSATDVVSDTRPDPEQAYCKQEIAERVVRATWRLSPALRTTFQLRDVDGLSIGETAHLLGVPSGTVKARLVRARLRLKQAIQQSRSRKSDLILVQSDDRNPSRPAGGVVCAD
jgi:RNA polymerase sigma-70 factor, ECF subfamily